MHDPADTVPDGVRRIQARVDAAASGLLREGQTPTVRSVRARMGGGGNNLVAAALQRWRYSLAGQLEDNAASALEVLPPAILEIVQALWSRAIFEAHRVKADSATDRDSRQHLAELRELADRLRERESRLDTLLADLEDRQDRLRAAERAIREREAALEQQWAKLTLRNRRVDAGPSASSVAGATRPRTAPARTTKPRRKPATISSRKKQAAVAKAPNRGAGRRRRT